MNENEFMETDRAQKIRQIVSQYGEGRFYISFSGGRDSTVLSEFMDIWLPGNKIPRVFADTGIELKSVRDFVVKKAESDCRVVMLKPSVNVVRSLEEDGYPFKSKGHSLLVGVYQNARHRGAKDGAEGKAVSHYLDPENRFGCPKMLRYQFTPENELKISDKCCTNMKEKPLNAYAKKTGRSPIIALLNAEGGRRAWHGQNCLIFRKGKLKSFAPFRVVSKEFIDYLVEKYEIRLADVYYPPYSFERTGCKGCPFNIHLQNELDTLERYFPKERAQCEKIWKPVYDEYRRLGYRLRKEAV